MNRNFDDLRNEILRAGQEFDRVVNQLEPQDQIELYKKHQKKMLRLMKEMERHHYPSPSRHPSEYSKINLHKELYRYYALEDYGGAFEFLTKFLVNPDTKQFTRTPDENAVEGTWDSLWLEKRYPKQFNVGHPWVFNSDGSKSRVEVFESAGRTLWRRIN